MIILWLWFIFIEQRNWGLLVLRSLFWLILGFLFVCSYLWDNLKSLLKFHYILKIIALSGWTPTLTALYIVIKVIWGWKYFWTSLCRLFLKDIFSRSIGIIHSFSGINFICTIICLTCLRIIWILICCIIPCSLDLSP